MAASTRSRSSGTPVARCHVAPGFRAKEEAGRHPQTRRRRTHVVNRYHTLLTTTDVHVNHFDHAPHEVHTDPDEEMSTRWAVAFVHAGIEPASFPDCADAVRLWTRSDRFFDHANWPEREELKNLLVVHGHTPRSYQPENFPHRINVDTGACFGGPLTAVMLKEGAEPQFLRGS